MENLKISIIIPVYNTRKYIAKCVNSIEAQSYDNVEVIIINDGSSDGSGEFCDELSNGSFLDIKVIHQNNQGVGVARNAGLKAATGDYILFLDADDWLNTDTVRELMNSVLTNNTDVTIFGFDMIDDDTLIKKWLPNCTIPTVNKNDFWNLHFWNLYDNQIIFNIGTKLYKSSIIKEHNLSFCEEMRVWEDVKFCIEYLQKCSSFSIINESYYQYYQHSSSALSTYQNCFALDTLSYINLLSNKFTPDEIASVCHNHLYRAFMQEYINKPWKYHNMKKNFVLLNQAAKLSIPHSKTIFDCLLKNKLYFLLYLYGIKKNRQKI